LIYDIIVVGAGPVGSTAAHVSAKSGLKTLLVEEHRTIGSPLHCAGKLSVLAFKEFNLPTDCILNSVKGAYFYPQNNIPLKISKVVTESHIIDRELLDRKLADRARDAGAETRLELKIQKILKKTEGILLIGRNLRGEASEVDARLVIDASGADSVLVRQLGLRGAVGFLRGIQYEVEGVEFEGEEYVELYFSHQMFPGFFSWIIPLGRDTARVGLCVREELATSAPQSYLENALRSHPILSKKVRGGKVVRVYGGRIPIHGPLKKTYEDSFLAVGDAAAHTKSTTGGGIYFGMKAARIGAEVAVECLERGLADAKSLSIYQQMCNREFGRELNFTSTARRVLDRLSDEDLNQFFNVIARDQKLLKNIERIGETAYQSKILLPMLTKIGRSTLKKPMDLQLFSKILLKGLIAQFVE
jgi:digeranylgeranylglycerophospholipid reductase